MTVKVTQGHPSCHYRIKALHIRLKFFLAYLYVQPSIFGRISRFLRRNTPIHIPAEVTWPWTYPHGSNLSYEYMH